MIHKVLWISVTVALVTANNGTFEHCTVDQTGKLICTNITSSTFFTTTTREWGTTEVATSSLQSSTTLKPTVSEYDSPAEKSTRQEGTKDPKSWCKGAAICKRIHFRAESREKETSISTSTKTKPMTNSSDSDSLTKTSTETTQMTTSSDSDTLTTSTKTTPMTKSSNSKSTNKCAGLAKCKRIKF